MDMLWSRVLPMRPAAPLFRLAVEDHSGAHGGVGQPVDDDEGAGTAVAPVGIVGQRLGERDRHATDLVERKGRRVLAVERVDVHPVAERAHMPGGELRRLLEEILLAGDKFLFGHPDHHRLEAIVDLRLVAGADEHVAAAGVDFVLEGKRHTLRRKRLLDLTVEGDDSLHPALLP